MDEEGRPRAHPVLPQLHGQGTPSPPLPFRPPTACAPLDAALNWQTTLRDMQASVLQLSEHPFNPEVAEKMPSLHYEFPNGYNRDFIAERMSIPEGLFDTSFLKVRPSQSPSQSKA